MSSSREKVGNRYWSAAAAALLASVSLGSGGGAVMAQDGTAAAATPSTAAVAAKPIPALTFTKTPARDIAAKLTSISGVTVVADSRVALASVTLKTIGGSVEKVAGQVVEQLPKGAVLRTIMLPAFAPGTPADADLIVSTYLAQEKLSGSVQGNKTERGAGDINVLGKILAADKAETVIAALDLKPVYVLTSTNGDDLVAKASLLQSEGLRLWGQMSPEQRSRLVDEQLNGLMNMEPTSRKAMLGQMMQQGMQVMQKMQQMTPEQRSQFLSDVKSAIPPGFPGTPGAPGGAPGSGGGGNTP